MGEPVKKPILYGGRFAGLNREYSGEYSREYSFGSAAALMTTRLGGSTARLVARLWLGSAQIWRACGSVVVYLWARGLRVVVCAESSGGACGLPLSPMKLILAPVSSS